MKENRKQERREIKRLGKIRDKENEKEGKLAHERQELFF